MARISMKGPGTVAEISAVLKERIPECGLTCEMVDCVSRGGTELMIFEKHYYRAGNFLTLTLMVSADGEGVIVDSLASGAREGIFDITWGAEEDFAEEAIEILQPLGFTVFDRSSEYTESSEAPDPEPIGDIMRRAMDARSERVSTGESIWAEMKSDEPERVTLGREEKKGLFGKKRNKPDWEY